MLNIDDPAVTEKTPAIWRLAFRPFFCWLTGRVLLLLPFDIPLLAPALFDSLFLELTAFKLWTSIYKVNQWHNIGFTIMLLPKALEQWLLVVAGGLHLIRWARMDPHQTLKEPMLWSLHIGYLLLPVTLLALAWSIDNLLAYLNLLHLFAIGTLAGICLSMISRVFLALHPDVISSRVDGRLG